MDIEVLHVSQLYETFVTFGVLFLLIGEILAYRKQLSSHSLAFRIKEYEEVEDWMASKLPQPETPAESKEEPPNPDLEKSAIESIRREMNEFEKKNSEMEKSETVPPEKEIKILKTQTLKFESSLTSEEKSLLLFHVEFNNFMSQHFSIILSILVIGMLTFSTRIFSLAVYFCYLFASLLFDFLHLQQKLKAQYRRGTSVRRLVKLVSGGFLLAIFINYWIVNQYSGQY